MDDFLLRLIFAPAISSTSLHTSQTHRLVMSAERGTSEIPFPDSRPRSIFIMSLLGGTDNVSAVLYGVMSLTISLSLSSS
jgi:hypothetical protein